MNSLSWLTSAARWAWPLGCGIDLCRDERVRGHSVSAKHLISKFESPWRYILANSNVEISCHFVDIHVSMYPAGPKARGTVLTMGKRSNTMWWGNIYHNIWEVQTLHCLSLWLHVQPCISSKEKQAYFEDYVPMSLSRRSFFYRRLED